MTVYLIHFEKPYKHASHYIGWTPGDLGERIKKHRQGKGAHLLKAANAAGIKWKVVRVWSGDHDFERSLHNKNHSSRLCPVCNSKVERDEIAEMIY